MKPKYEHLCDIARDAHSKLTGLAVAENCWCGVGIGDPRLSGKHDDQCREIKRFMKSLEYTIENDDRYPKMLDPSYVKDMMNRADPEAVKRGES